MTLAPSQSALRRLRSKRAQHFGVDGPTITVMHKHPLTGALLVTTGRLVAETAHEVALLVRSTPEVIATRRIVSRITVTGRS